VENESMFMHIVSGKSAVQIAESLRDRAKQSKQALAECQAELETPVASVLRAAPGVRVRRYDDRTVRHADRSILGVLAGLAAHHGKSSCWPSQEKLAQLVEQRAGRRMSLRTLNRHLAALERDLFIRRIRRHRRARNGSLELHSTCYVLCERGVRALVDGARSIARVIGAQWRGFPTERLARYARSIAAAVSALPAPAVNLRTSLKEVIRTG
jgi:hypothetical protein